MVLKEMLQTYEFSELFAELAIMYPPARKKKALFQKAFAALLDIRPVENKKRIHYQLMRDPDSNEMFYGADDSNFKAAWAVVIGKDVTVDHDVDLNDLEITANCLLNTILISRPPRFIEDDINAIKQG